VVALAPITNETPAWDVLDAFPKLHSRARDEKTTPCTEVPMHKSRNCIEIWLTIYETCDGLESFTRDPIGYEDGPSLYMEYFFLGGTDPDGENVHSCYSSEVRFEQGVKDLSPKGATSFAGIAAKGGLRGTQHLFGWVVAS
jgi:hypothetical protein